MSFQSRGFLDTVEEKTKETVAAPVAPVSTTNNSFQSGSFLNELNKKEKQVVQELPMTPEETTIGQDIDNGIKAIKETATDLAGFIDYLPEYYADKDAGDIAGDFVEGANVMAHGVNKGLVAAADLATVPLQAATSAVAAASNELFGTQLNTSVNMFSKSFQQHFPDADYIPEEQAGMFDDLVRLTHTGLEFTSGTAITGGANMVNAGKGIVKVDTAKEGTLSLLSGLGYQSAKELGGDETDAMIWSFVAPMAPAAGRLAVQPKEAAKLVGEVAKGATKLTGKVIVETPLVGTLIKGTAKASAGHLRKLKQDMLADPSKWDMNWVTRMGRKFVMSVPEEAVSFEQRVAALKHLDQVVSDAIPQTKEVVDHSKKMSGVENMINDYLESAGKPRDFKLTLGQRYGKALKDMNAKEGLDDIESTLRILYNDEYNAQILKNRELFNEFLSNNHEQLRNSPEMNETFTGLFNDYFDQLGKTQENIVAEANKATMDTLKTFPVKAYQEPQDAINADLRPALKKLEGLYKEAYDKTLESLPADLSLDTTPLSTAITDMYDNLGVFADPKSTPAYVKSLINAFKKIAPDIAGETKKNLDDLRTVGNELNVLKKQNVKAKNDLKVTRDSALKDLDESAENYSQLKAEIEDKYNTDLKALTDEATEISTKVNENEIAKRVAKGEIQENAADPLKRLEPPTLATLGDVREASRIVNKAMRDAYKSGDMDAYNHLKGIRGGIDNTMVGLKEHDEQAYARYQRANDGYHTFVAQDFVDSPAGKVIANKDHHAALTSNDAADLLWNKADDDDIALFLKNFDNTREGLDDFLSILADEGVKAKYKLVDGKPELLTAGTAGRDPMQEYTEISAEASKVLKDMAYSSLLRELAPLDVVKGADPVKRLERMETTLQNFAQKHRSKFRYIPGMEDSHSNINAMVSELAEYRKLWKDAETARGSRLIQRVAGPNKTIMNIANSREVAQEMADFLGNVNSKMSKTSEMMTAKYPEAFKMTPQNSAEAVNKIQDILMDSFIDQFTDGPVVDGNRMQSVLSNVAGSRQNLVDVLGEARVMKLEAIASISQSLKQSERTFTQVLQEDSTLKAMENVGLPLSRISARLNQRAVFRPSTAYIGGAVATAILDNVSKRETARSLKFLMDDPTQLAEFHKVLGREIQKLDVQRIQNELKNPNGSTRNLISILEKPLAKIAYRYYSLLGYTIQEEDYREYVREALLNKETENDSGRDE